MRVFLSFHSPDQASAVRIKRAIEERDAATAVFLSANSLQAGAFWLPRLGREIAEADACLLLLGPAGVGPWQLLEYYEAIDRRAREPGFAVVPVVTGPSAPGLPFLRQLHWLSAPHPEEEPHLTSLLGALRGESVAFSQEPWRTTNPYRGLPALREEDAAYFFGRDDKVTEILAALARRQSQMIVMIGNSGVGKSSLARAGVIGTLRRNGSNRSVAGHLEEVNVPEQSRAWAYLAARPGDNPVRAVAAAFIRYWSEERGDPQHYEWLDGWERRLASRGRLGELIDETEARFAAAGTPAPPRFLLYLDQIEEMYAATIDERRAHRFSDLIAEAVEDPRLLLLASQRSDTYGRLQADLSLFPKTLRVDVPPLDAEALTAVLTRPAQVLGARFESEALVSLMVDSARSQPGALPLLADHMADLWARMQARGDGVIRVTHRSEIVQVSSTLARRADRFVAEHDADLQVIKRLFCLKLTSVPREGEPARRPVPRSECDEREWRLIESMSDASWRLLVVGQEQGVPQAEIAHEVLLREWPSLKEWLQSERRFLVWRGDIEHACRQSLSVSTSERPSTMLTGRTLTEAEFWLKRRPQDIGPQQAAFITEGLARRRQQARAMRILASLVLACVLIQPLAVLSLSQLQQRLVTSRTQSLRVQAEIIASAIAASTTPDSTLIDADQLLESGTAPDPLINPEQIAPLFRHLIGPTNTRARLYDGDGLILLDSQTFSLVAEEPPLWKRWYLRVYSALARAHIPQEAGQNLPEVEQALSGGVPASTLRLNPQGALLVSVAAPVKRARRTIGALVLSSQGTEIDDAVLAERGPIAGVFLLSLVTGLASIVLVIRAMRGIITRGGAEPSLETVQNARPALPSV